MELKTKRILIGCVTIAIMILMIVYVDFQTILLYLQRISIWGIFLFSVIYTLAFIFRAFKLKLVFNGINFEPNYFIIYGAIGTGWAINELTPAKLGDFVKMEYIRQKENNFPLSKCLCAVLIDRFIDLIILFSITCFTLLYIYLSSVTYITQLNLHFFIIIGALILFIGVLGLTLLFFKTDWILSITDRISPKLKNLLERFIVRFEEGLKDLRKDKKRILLILLYNILLFGAVFIGYMIFRIKKADLLEITFFSIIVMFSVLFWRRTYVRYLTPLILYGHLTTKESIFTIDIDFKIAWVHFQAGNHFLTYFFSILGCVASIAIILFLWI